MKSLSVLKTGKSAAWRINLANAALEFLQDGDIYQQSGTGQENYIIHACPNYGEPFDSARHHAAKAVWTAAQEMKKPATDKEKAEAIAILKSIWSRT